jgi:hypothetical protein
MFQEGVTPNLAELLIDLEEEPAIRAAVVAELGGSCPWRVVRLCTIPRPRDRGAPAWSRLQYRVL